MLNILFTPFVSVLCFLARVIGPQGSRTGLVVSKTHSPGAVSEAR
jgi:hypothetical protein